MTLSADQDSSGGQAVMDGEGNGLVVWGSDSRLYAKKYSVSQGWDSDMTRFDNAVLRAGALKIAMNENGEGVAVWRLEETGGDFFYARRFDMTSGWDDDAQRLCDNSYDGQRPDVSINSGGNILTVFSKYTTNDVYARSYTPGSDWDAGPTVIDSLN
ncbi:MAG: hypothetical protein KKA41_11805, partial [Proteobacteria bacterium]|nr:hypothetical protein [Pseudomonadota bacterium]